MRTTLLAILMISTQWIFGQYDETFFTVTAPSGLSLREGPGIDYDRLAAIPFNTQITVLEDQINYQERDTINDIAGYWVPVTYQNQQGYLFSPYFKRGHLFTPSSAGINQQFRIVIPGMRVSALNYDPEMNWYALVSKAGEEQGEFRLQKVDPIVQFEPMTVEEQFNWGVEGLVSMEVDLMEDYVALLIGTQQPLKEVEQLIQETYFNPQSDYLDWGRPVYPFEQLDLFQTENRDVYALSGHVQANPVSEDVYNAVEFYLGISKNRYAGDFYETPGQKLTSEMMTEGYEYDGTYPPATFQYHPRIFWQGDLNGDQMPDLIFYKPNMSECCGGYEGYFLLLSEQKGTDNWEWHRAADDVLESFGGC